MKEIDTKKYRKISIGGIRSNTIVKQTEKNKKASISTRRGGCRGCSRNRTKRVR